jgi:hypothetical protein
MKHGKKPNVRQSIFLRDNGWNPNEWLVVKDTTEEMQIISRKGNRDEVRIHSIKKWI